MSIPGNRIKYYFAWVFGDLVNNVSGLGFNGYDEKGEPRWDLVTNVNIIEFEVRPACLVLATFEQAIHPGSFRPAQA